MSANTDPSDLMVQFYRGIFKGVVEEVLNERNANFPAVDEETAAKIARINAKPHITVQEAALLLSCSESHFYTKIKEARKKTSSNPIPFLDLDGVYVFPRDDLLTWAHECKERKERKRKGPRRLAVGEGR